MKLPHAWPRQPFVGLGIAAIAGIVFAELSPHPDLALALLLSIALVAWWRRSSVALFCFAAACFFYLHSVRQTDSAGLHLARALGDERQAIAVGGVVVSEPRMSDRGGASFSLRLRWFERNRERLASDATVLARWRGAVRYGDEVQLFGVIQPMEGPRNPGEFDMRAYLARRDIRQTLIVRYPENGKTISSGGGSRILRAAQASRRWMQAALARGLEDAPDLNSLISGMVLGVRDETPDEIEEQFQQTGTLHLFAASGLNVAMVAYLLGTIAHAARLSRRWAVALIIPALFFYAAITGLNTSSVRAALMGAFLLGSLFFDRRVFAVNSIAASAVFILGLDTNQLFATGFQLSFAVVLAIIALAEPLYKALVRWSAPDPFRPKSLLSLPQRLGHASWQTLARGASVSLAAWIGSWPLILPYFYLITPVSLFANLVVVPIAFFVLAVGLLALLAMPVAPWLAVIFNNANWSLAAAILATVAFFTRAPAGHFYMELPHRASGAEVEVTMLDLGGGAAVHVRTPESDWLIDCGGVREFKRIVRGYLHSRGVNQLDGVILTHGDSRHLGAGPSIERAFHPRTWVDTAAPDRSSAHKELVAHLAAQRIERRLCAAPDELRLARSVKARFLFPPAGFRASNADDQATAIQIEVMRRWCILLMSDAGLATERALLDADPELESNILIKGQHHSGISGSAEFLERVRPRLLIASSAEFPENERVKEDWAREVAQRSIRLFRQDRTGAVSLRFYRDHWEAVPFLPGETFSSP